MIERCRRDFFRRGSSSWAGRRTPTPEVNFEKLECRELISREYRFVPSSKGTHWYIVITGKIFFGATDKSTEHLKDMFSGMHFQDPSRGEKELFDFVLNFQGRQLQILCIPRIFCHENIDLNKNEKMQETIYAIIDTNLLKILVVLILPHGRMT